jgi:hypothetical protein
MTTYDEIYDYEPTDDELEKLEQWLETHGL